MKTWRGPARIGARQAQAAGGDLECNSTVGRLVVQAERDLHSARPRHKPPWLGPAPRARNGIIDVVAQLQRPPVEVPRGERET